MAGTVRKRSLLEMVDQVEPKVYEAGERVLCAECAKPISTVINSGEKVKAWVLCPACTLRSLE